MIAAALATIALAGGSCQEDEACWNWATMGNHKRGVSSIRTARRLVVGPCRFKRLVRQNKIYYKPMRGDATAIKKEC